MKACSARWACRNALAGGMPELCIQAKPWALVIGVDLSTTSMQVALMRPDMTVLSRHREPIDVRQGPSVILARVRGADACAAGPLRACVPPGNCHRHGHWLLHRLPRAGVPVRQWFGGRCGPHLCGPVRTSPRCYCGSSALWEKTVRGSLLPAETACQNSSCPAHATPHCGWRCRPC